MDLSEKKSGNAQDSTSERSEHENVLDRRSFLKKAGSTAFGATAFSAMRVPMLQAEPSEDSQTEKSRFASGWSRESNRQWAGPEFWANPLQDWRLRRGRMECFTAGGDRNLALLTRELVKREGTFSTSVRLGQLDKAALTTGFAGFRLGTKSSTDDFRARAIYGQGLNAGITGDGRLFVGEATASAPTVSLDGEIRLHLHAKPVAGGYTISMQAINGNGHQVEINRLVPAEWLQGGVALVCSSGTLPMDPGKPAPMKDFSFYPPHQRRGGSLRFWFADWEMSGSKLSTHEDRTFGPIFFTLYTVDRGTLKLSAQLPPMDDASPATLQVQAAEDVWKTVAVSSPDLDAWNAVFRVSGWDATRDQPYRVLYSLRDRDGNARQYTYAGTIRKDPVEKPEMTIGLLTCLWDLGFPHTDFTTNLAYHKPDLLLWTGDQVYEPVGGFGVIESRDPELLEPALLDFLRKWYIFGWSVRELTRDIPSVCMTDDHDMYHGNIWGCGGRPTNPSAGMGASGQDSGGYKMPARWVNAVQRMQTAHLPDPFDPTPVDQGIGVYYSALQWGGVSFAIMEDRKWKSAPKQQLPKADIYNGFAMNPAWNTAHDAGPRAELLGQRQMSFLEAWAADWSGGTWMKYAVSQTIFGCLHTEPKGVRNDDQDPDEAIPPVGTYVKGDLPVADHDSGAWPQDERNAAIALWRKGFAAHLCGDQHLGTTSHYGVKAFRDGVYSVCTPAISNIWPRRWWPPKSGANPLPGVRNSGDFLDAFGNRISVLAAANPAQYEGPGPESLRFRATGYTIVTCNRQTRATTITEWPRWADPSQPGAKPYAGWPITIQQLDNGLWGAAWELPSIMTPEFRDPVVQVQHEASGETVYTLRINGTSFRPLVREPGRHRVLAYDPDGEFRMEWRNMEATRIDNHRSQNNSKSD